MQVLHTHMHAHMHKILIGVTLRRLNLPPQSCRLTNKKDSIQVWDAFPQVVEQGYLEDPQNNIRYCH